MLLEDGRLNRRTMLRGIGAGLALPWLEIMEPRSVYAADAKSVIRTAGGTSASNTPRRWATLYVPNGIHMPDWTPKQEGTNFELPEILKALNPYKNSLLVLTGLTADKARAHGDGGGDHARASSAFMTGCQPRKTDGANIKAGISADQVAARRLGNLTRLPSLELGCEPGRTAGNCDSGYSCAYSSTISWSSETTPVPHEVNPKLVFERLFGGGETKSDDRARRNRLAKSVLDSVLDDARRLRSKLGSTDQRKLDEYLNSVREIEQRIDRAEKMPPPKPPTGAVKPEGVPKDYAEHLRMMSDLLVLAFQTDSTRVATYVLANEGSNRPYRNINVSEGHHDLSHHENKPDKQAKIREINKFHMEQLAYIAKRMSEIKEGNASLLDNVVLVYGSGNSDGNRHNHDDLPIVALGKLGGSLKTGRHVRYPKETPLNNLWLSILDRLNAGTDRLGDSTGRLSELS